MDDLGKVARARGSDQCALTICPHPPPVKRIPSNSSASASIASRRERRLTLDYTPGCSVLEGAKAMQIGIVAKKVGLSVDAIRFYERNALLPRAPRTQGGFRQYGEKDVETLAFIRRVQGLGFKLSEIRGLLNLRGNRLQPCAPVQRRLQEKLAYVQRKLI